VTVFWKSVAFAVLILGAAMVIGALTREGAWLTITGAAGGLVSAFCLRGRPGGRRGSQEAPADA
jgi:hypothetical protein